MKKVTLFISTAIVLIISTMSCNDSKTIQEYIREEEQAIERFLKKENFDVTTKWPGFEAFQKNDKLYYKTDGTTYVYMHIVDRGDTAHKVTTKDKVQVRFESLTYIKTYVSGDTTRYAFADVGPYYASQPLEFRYGNSASYTADLSGLACAGWATPLTPDFEGAVGEGAIVDLIIPSVSGNSTDNTNFQPVYYKRLKYTRFY